MDRFNSSPLPYPGAGTASAAERITTFLRAAYGWMAAGLAVTAVVAVFMAASPELVFGLARNRLAFWGIAIAQLGVVFYLSARVNQLSPTTAAANVPTANSRESPGRMGVTTNPVSQKTITNSRR